MSAVAYTEPYYISSKKKIESIPRLTWIWQRGTTKKSNRDCRQRPHESVFAIKTHPICWNILEFVNPSCVRYSLLYAKMIQKIGSIMVLIELCTNWRRSIRPWRRLPRIQVVEVFHLRLIYYHWDTTYQFRVPWSAIFNYIWALSSTSSRILLSTHTLVQASWLEYLQRMHLCVFGVFGTYLDLDSLNHAKTNIHLCYRDFFQLRRIVKT